MVIAKDLSVIIYQESGAIGQLFIVEYLGNRTKLL